MVPRIIRPLQIVSAGDFFAHNHVVTIIIIKTLTGGDINEG